MRTYNLKFEGSYLDQDRFFMPDYSGVYLVYRGVPTNDGNSLICKELMYIGQASDIRSRIENHDRREDFIQRAENGESVFYSCAKCNPTDLDRIENALIYRMQPPLNNNGILKFPYPDTQIVSTGECALLDKDFTIEN